MRSIFLKASLNNLLLRMQRLHRQYKQLISAFNANTGKLLGAA